MTEVRRHQRQTASGKTTTVRQHERNVGGQAWADRVQETTQRGWQVPPAGETPPPPRDDGNWWDDDEATPAGDWWAEDDQQTASCPACGLSLPVNAGGNLAGHKDARDPDRYCTGSGTTQPGSRGPAEVKPLPRQARPTARSPEERYEAARRALNENALRDYAAGTGDETPEFLQLNHEVAEARQGVSGWQRSRIDNRVADEQDYDAQMRQIRRQMRKTGEKPPVRERHSPAPAESMAARPRATAKPKPAAAPAKPADPMDTAGRRNVAADKKVREAKDEVRRAGRGRPLLSRLQDTPEQAVAREQLRQAFGEQDAAEAERAEIFERYNAGEAARRGVPAYESPLQRWWRKKHDGR